MVVSANELKPKLSVDNFGRSTKIKFLKILAISNSVHQPNALKSVVIDVSSGRSYAYRTLKLLSNVTD